MSQINKLLSHGLSEAVKTMKTKVSVNKLIRNSTVEFLMFTLWVGEESIEVKVEGETVWLTQTLMAELFGKSVSTINEHIKNIYAEQELSGV